MRRGVVLAVLWLSVAWACEAVGGGPGPRPALPGRTGVGASAPGGESYDSYRILTSRNIFVRDRSRPRSPRMTYERPRPMPTYRRSMMLTGIAQGGDQWEAFLEESGTERTLRVVAGESLGGGRVVSVSIEGIEYARDGVTRKIAVGDDLAGVGAATAPPDEPPGGQAAAGSTTRPATSGPPASETPVDSDTKSILEKLRLRRLQETK